jgi:hypothetical protein
VEAQRAVRWRRTDQDQSWKSGEVEIDNDDNKEEKEKGEEGRNVIELTSIPEADSEASQLVVTGTFASASLTAWIVSALALESFSRRRAFYFAST